MLRQFRASVFNKFMTSGRTTPALLTCERDGEQTVDFVVKLSGGMDSGTSQAVFEVVATNLAQLLQIYTPEPALVFLSQEMADLISELQPKRASVLQRSVGWNFGSTYMRNFSVWPVDRTLSPSQVDVAGDIFAFDALIQNPDRTFKNPNLGMNGGDICVIDHECAFSFVYNILKNQSPWVLSTERYLDDHVFSRPLRKKVVDWHPFLQQLERLDPSFFSQMRAMVPDSWDTSNLQKLEDHLIAVRNHAADFEMELQRRIA